MNLSGLSIEIVEKRTMLLSASSATCATKNSAFVPPTSGKHSQLVPPQQSELHDVSSGTM
jgi:hypothetical protein